jgi:predicted deacylase
MIELKSKTIVGAADGPRLLITGGVHGDEFEPMTALRRLIEEIDPDDLKGTLQIVPVVNESAFARRHRCGDDGLDLARTCPGNLDGSITEQTAQALTQLIDAADYYIDLHTGGSTMSVFPLAGYILHPDASTLAVQRRMARAFNLPLIWGTDASLNGRSMSAARDANVPAIYTEYHGAGRCEPAGVEAYIHGCLNVMNELGMIERKFSPKRGALIVEDTRPGSGHMQIQNPSPVAGFFESAVELGSVIGEGELLGIVTDPLGDAPLEVRSRQKGMVIVLRTLPRVEQDDALAVILEID